MNQGNTILPSGTILDNGCFKVLNFLGKGGFGITYLALEIGIEVNIGDGETEIRQTAVQNEVVIKELFYDEFCSRDAETKLITISRLDKKVEFEKLVDKQIEEGRNQRKLLHKYIVRNKKIFKDNGTAYIVMEYLQGSDLEELLEKSNRLSVEKAVKYIRQILEALAHVHNQKVLHLDIKPSNIFIKKDIDDAILIDFGASLSYDDEGKVKSTTSKLVSGVSYYAPPEQRSLEGLKARNNTLDTFSVAGTLYHCLTGIKPIEAVNRMAHDSLVMPSEMNLGISDYYDAVLEKGLSIPYKNRIQSAADFIIALDNASSYESYIKEAQDLYTKKQFTESLETVKKAAGFIGDTKTTNNLALLCQEGINEKINLAVYEKHFNLGLQYETQSNYKAALKEYESARQLIPAKNEVAAKINFCKLQIAEIEKTELINSLLINAESFKGSEEYDKALAQLNKVLEIDPANNRGKAMQLEIEKLKEQAVKQKKIKELVSVADTLVSKKEWDEAISKYEEIKLRYPTNTFEQEIDKKIQDCMIAKGKDESTELITKKGIEEIKEEAKEETIILTSARQKENGETKPIVPLQRKKSKPIWITVTVLILLSAFLVWKFYQRDTENYIANPPTDTTSREVPIYDSMDNTINDTAKITVVGSNASDNQNVMWKTEFLQKFNKLKSYEDAITLVEGNSDLRFKFENLLKTLPADALHERSITESEIKKLKKIEENYADRQKAEMKLRAQAHDLADEGDVLFTQNKSAEALKKYIEANNVFAGSGNVGYTRFLNWGKEQFTNFGQCEGCKAEKLCKNFVIDKMKKALQINPSGKEAKDILNCLN